MTGRRLGPYELDAIRQRDQNARDPARTWAVQDRRDLLRELDRLAVNPAPAGRPATAAEVRGIYKDDPAPAEPVHEYRINAGMGLQEPANPSDWGNRGKDRP